MSLPDCLQRAVDAKEIEADRAALARDEYLRLERDHRAAGMSAEEAAAQAALDLGDAKSREVVARRYATLRQLERNRVNREDLLSHRNARGELDPADGLIQFLENNHTARYGNAVHEEGVLRDRYHAAIANVLRRHGLNAVGSTRNRAGLRNVVRELSGEATGDAAAKEAAEALREALEMARRDFNAAGGNIGWLEGYDLPHIHNRPAILKAGLTEWKAALFRGLDWTKIENPQTGFPFSRDGGLTPEAEADAHRFLEEIYTAIDTDNWSRMEPGMVARGAGLRRRRSQHRTFHFKSADDWLAYQNAFGEGDPFTTVMNHLHGMARDTALMRVLGPNPQGGMEFLRQSAEQAVMTAEYATPAAKARASARVRSAGAQARTMLAQLDGSANVPDSVFWARFLAGVRQALTSIQLGSAMLSAVTDYGTIALQSVEFGGSGTRAIGRVLKLYNPANHSDRALAAKLGLIADHLGQVTNASARFTGDMLSVPLVERLPHITMRLSGLAQMTSAARMAVKMEFMGVLGANRGRAWAELHPWLRGKLEGGGLGAAEWDTIRRLEPIHSDVGEGFLVPDHIRTADLGLDADAAEALATRLHSVMLQQQELAVPSASLRGRAMLIGDSKPGSWLGELGRSGAMYKSFALSVLFNQILGRLRRLPPGRRGVELAKFVAVSTILGGVALQLKEIAKGRDPRPMTGGEFWYHATLQGGGLGIFGDFITAETSRLGGGFAETLAGPVVGLASSLAGAPIRAVDALIGDRESNAGREASRIARYNTPVFSSLWWARAAYDRLVMDQVQAILDPEARQAWRRADRRRRRAYGNDAWWSSGKALPERAPDLGAALEAGP